MISINYQIKIFFFQSIVCSLQNKPGGGHFISHESIDVNQTLKENYLIRELITEKFDCIYKCYTDWSCSIYMFNDNECHHYNNTATEYLIKSESEKTIYIRRE